MREDAKKVADIIRRHRSVTVVTHIDADGICAGAIASLALERAGIGCTVKFVKQLDPEAVQSLKTKDAASPDGKFIWFTDLGSGSLSMLEGLDCVIADHHTPSAGPDIPSVNPHLRGHSGATDLSGAGAAYLVARELDPSNTDLCALAIVGAVGDLQDAAHCKLVGLNRELLDEGIRACVLDSRIDIRYFGRETRPLYKMLQYSSDPVIPGVTADEQAAIALVADLGIPLKTGEEWRTWSLLDDEERKAISSAIVLRLISHGFGHQAAKRLIGEVYVLIRESPGTPLRDAKEFATLLNSCGRHDKPEVGYRVCRGERGEGLTRALSLLQDHRRSLVEGIQLVKELGIRKLGCIQHFNAGDGIEDTLVGVVAGMLLGSGEGGADPNLPIIAFANSEDGKGLKVSARANRALVDKGLDLSVVMRTATAAVGGSGGGHNVAAGGLIPEGAEQKFLEEVERMVRAQLKI